MIDGSTRTWRAREEALTPEETSARSADLPRSTGETCVPPELEVVLRAVSGVARRVICQDSRSGL